MSMLRSLLVAAVAATALLAQPSLAADSQGRFVPKGVGRMTCAEFSKLLTEKKTAEIENIVSWIAGYATAVNATSASTFDIMPWQNENVMFELVARLCSNNEQENFTNIMQQLVGAFMPLRLTSREQLVEIKNGDKTAKVHPTTIRVSQETLIKLGLLTGTADGSFGPKTKTAIESFQDKAKITKTGILDTDTLFALFLVRAQGVKG
jgi:hypothetical protein